MNYTYIVECSDHTYYTGWTNNLDKRIQAHNSGKGAKYTKSRMPVRLVYYETFQTKQEAMRREYEIKQCSRKQKLRLMQTVNASIGHVLPAGDTDVAVTNCEEAQRKAHV